MSCPDPWLAACEAADAISRLAPEAQEQALRQLRDQDPALAESVQTLLQAEKQSAGLGVASSDEVAPQTLPPEFFDRRPVPLYPEGTRIGPYLLGTALGVGAMGAVYRAERVEPYRQQVAMKLMHATLDATSQRRFEAERQFLAALEHQGIVRLLDGGVTPEGVPYLVTEYIDGPRLDQYAADPAHGIDDRVELILQITLAMAYAHGRHVLHRDLSPANVLVAPDGTAKVTDFGLARPTPQAAAAAILSDSGVLMGTAGYIAPERLLGGAASNSPAADVYAIGALLYRVLAGQAPFVGSTPIQTCMMAANQAPAPLRRIDPKLPRDLNTIVQKALARDPNERFASALDLADQLRHFLAREPLTIKPPSRTERFSKWSLKNRRSILAWAGGVSVLMLAVIGLLATWNQALREDQAALRQVLRSVSASTTRLLESSPPGSGGTLKIYEELVRDFDSVLSDNLLTGDAILRRQVALMHYIRGRAANEQKVYQQAITHLDRAIELLSSLPPLIGDPLIRRWVRFDLFRAHQARAIARQNLGEISLAQDDYESGFALIEGIEREEPENPDWLEAEARSRVNLANIYYTQGRMDEAERETSLSLELASRAEKLAPGKAAICNTLLAIHVTRANIARFLNRPEQVERELRRACQAVERVVDPGEYRWAVDSARRDVLHALGNCLIDQQRHDEARPSLEQALALSASLISEFPTNEKYRQNNRLIRDDLARCEQQPGATELELEPVNP